MKRERIFGALTRSQMFAGVTYSFFVINGIIAAELFLIFRSFWVIGAALLVHVIGMLVSIREPRTIDLWLIRVSRCPRVRNHRLWQCNSYRP